MSNKVSAIVGSLIHSVKFGQLETIAHGAVIFNGSLITQVVDLEKNPTALEGISEVIDHSGKIIIPGLIDAHCHAPQYVFSGTGMDLPLLEWLNKYTFPTESRFKDAQFARFAYEKAVKRHMKCGTTFAAYYATIHLDASKVLVEVIQSLGQRAFVGKVNMDRNSPDFYVENTDGGCAEAEEFVRFVLNGSEMGRKLVDIVDSTSKSMTEETMEQAAAAATPVASSAVIAAVGSSTAGPVSPSWFESRPTLLNKASAPLVLPIVTPRFVPTCTPAMMNKLGLISYKYGVPVQSHLSESNGEIEWVKALHPECTTYAGVYNKYHLLHSATIMGHCCFSTKEERAVMKRANTAAVHCASSNFNLNSGVMDVRLFLADGIKVGLGTDVAGGHSASMLDCMRQTLVASRVVGFEQRDKKASASSADAAGSAAGTVSLDDINVEYPPMNYQEIFHLATVGSAEALGMGNVVGNFMPGKVLDCLVVNPEVAGGPIDIFPGETLLERFQKFLFLGDDRNIEHIYINGNKVQDL